MAKKKPTLKRKPHPSGFGELTIPRGVVIVDGATCDGGESDWGDEEKPDVEMRGPHDES